MPTHTAPHSSSCPAGAFPEYLGPWDLSNDGTHHYDVRGSLVNVQHWAKGDGTTNDRQAFLDAATAAGTGGILVPPGTYRIQTSATIGGRLQLLPGALLSVDAGQTVTLSQPPIAGPWAIVTGSGSVVCTVPPPQVYPEWFGAVGDGTTNDRAAFVAAGAFHATVRIGLTRTYRIQTSLTLGSGVILESCHAGGKLSIDGSQTLTLSTNPPIAGPWQVFAGSGAVTYSTPCHGPLLAEWFGAKGDGATDDTTALQKAVNALPNGGEVRLLAGEYRIASEILCTTNGLRFGGAGMSEKGTVLRYTGTTGTLLRVSACQFVTLENFTVYYANVPTAGETILIHNDCAFTCVENVFIQWCYNGITIRDGTECRLKRINIRFPYGNAGIQFTGTAAVGSYRCIVDDFIADAGPPLPYGTLRSWATSTAFTAGDMVNQNGNMYQCVTSGTSASSGTGPSGGGATIGANIADGTVAWRFVYKNTLTWMLHDSYGYSLVLDKCALLNGAYGLRQIDSALTGTSFPIWIFAYDVECDHNFFAGISLDRGEGAFFTTCWVGSCIVGNGIVIGANYRGETGIQGATRIMGNAQHGVLLEAGPRHTSIDGAFCVNNGASQVNTFHGIMIASNASDFVVTNNACGLAVGGGGNNQGYGIFVSNSCSNYVIQGNQCTGNGLGGILDGTGTSKVVKDNLPNYTAKRLTITVTSGQTTGQVAHTLGATPATVVASPRTNPGAHWWATATSTNVVINLASAAGSTLTFDAIATREA